MPKKEENKIVEIRSDEVQEILSYIPNWMIRWGITLIFTIIILLLFVSWFIKYPDVVTGEVIITTKNPPIKIVALSSGNLQNLKVTENIAIEKNQIIAEIQADVFAESIDYLKTLLAYTDSFLLSKSLKHLQYFDTTFVLGALQQEYNLLVTNLKEYEALLKDDYHKMAINSLKKQIAQHQKISTISVNELKIFEKELENAELKYDANKKLLDNKAIALIEFKEEETKYLQFKKSIESQKKLLAQNKITLAQLENQLNELTKTHSEKMRLLNQTISTSLKSLKSAIHSWQFNQTIKSPISGKLSFLKTINENQFINQGDELFVVVPENENYLGYIKLPIKGEGKVKEKQRVRIKLSNFPHHEYGQINGIVQQVSLIANENNYLVKITLPNKLVSSYGKELAYKPEMSGTAEIITEDLRLIERIFNTFRKLVI